MKTYPRRRFSIGDRADSGWEFFKTILFPGEQQLQWMMDRAVVDSLTKHGDPLTERRRVDHWIYFEDAAGRDAFEAAANAAGFATVEASKTPADDGRLGIQVHREDFVDLDRIHAVVMELVELAKAHRGDYDGWETAVLKPNSPD
jgi:regulator of RNase E activity RraB